MKGAVSDTHPLLFHAAGRLKLSRRAAAFFDACEARKAVLYVPAAVMWEVALLQRVGKIDLDCRVRTFFETLFGNPAYQWYDLTPVQVYGASEQRPNDDPFDGLICAAARELDLPLITRDGEIQDSGLVDIIW